MTCQPYLLVLMFASLVATVVAAGAQAPRIDVAVGDRFIYSAVHPEKPAGTEKQGGVVYVTSLLPNAQTITVVEEKACGSTACLALEAQRTLPDYGLGKSEVRNTSTSRARLDAVTGNLIDIEQTILVAGQENKTSAAAKSKHATFADFYGPWMLDLRPGYKESFPLTDGRARTYEVVRQEKIVGRNAFVVKRRTPQPGGRILETTYWVDVERRFALQVEQDGWRMTLQKSSSKS